MPTRCTSHGISVGEYIEYFRHIRSFYRAETSNEDEVSRLIVAEMNRLVDTRDDFYARRDAYYSSSAEATGPMVVPRRAKSPTPKVRVASRSPTPKAHVADAEEPASVSASEPAD
jgi:hypothetical protein